MYRCPPQNPVAPPVRPPTPSSNGAIRSQLSARPRPLPARVIRLVQSGRGKSTKLRGASPNIDCFLVQTANLHYDPPSEKTTPYTGGSSTSAGRLPPSGASAVANSDAHIITTSPSPSFTTTALVNSNTTPSSVGANLNTEIQGMDTHHFPTSTVVLNPLSLAAPTVMTQNSSTNSPIKALAPKGKSPTSLAPVGDILNKSFGTIQNTKTATPTDAQTLPPKEQRKLIHANKRTRADRTSSTDNDQGFTSFVFQHPSQPPVLSGMTQHPRTSSQAVDFWNNPNQLSYTPNQTDLNDNWLNSASPDQPRLSPSVLLSSQLDQDCSTYVFDDNTTSPRAPSQSQRPGPSSDAKYTSSPQASPMQTDANASAIYPNLSPTMNDAPPYRPSSPITTPQNTGVTTVTYKLPQTLQSGTINDIPVEQDFNQKILEKLKISVNTCQIGISERVKRRVSFQPNDAQPTPMDAAGTIPANMAPSNNADSSRQSIPLTTNTRMTAGQPRYDQQHPSDTTDQVYLLKSAVELARKLVERASDSLNQKLFAESAKLKLCPEASLWVGIPIALVPANIRTSSDRTADPKQPTPATASRAPPQGNSQPTPTAQGSGPPNPIQLNLHALSSAPDALFSDVIQIPAPACPKGGLNYISPLASVAPQENQVFSTTWGRPAGNQQQKRKQQKKNQT